MTRLFGLLLIVLVCLPSCGITPTGRAAWEGISLAVNYYCAQSEERRKALRTFVAQRTAPNLILIDCDDE